MSSSSSRPFVFAVVFVSVLLFGPSLGGGFASDDYRLLVQDGRIADPDRLSELLSTPFWGFDVESGAVASHYERVHRPLVKLAFVLGHRVGGGRPFGFHAVAVATHLVVVALVFRFLRRRVDDDWAAFAGAMLFAVHPSRAETVAWISGVSDSLMALFALLAAEVAALRTERAALRGVGLLVLGFACAASKEPGLLVAPLLVAIEMASVETTARRRAIPVLATVGGASAAIGLALYVGRHASPMAFRFELVRPLAAFGAALQRVVVPGPITTMPFPMRYAEGGVPVYPPSLVVLGLLGLLAGLALVALARGRRSARPLALAFVVFFVAYLPVLGFDGHDVPTLLCDRFAYVPLLGIAWMVASAVGMADVSRRRGLSLLACLVALAFLPTTTQGVALYGDENALVAHELSLHPDAPQEIAGLAMWKLRHGRNDEAFRELMRAADLALVQHRPGGGSGYIVVALSARVQATPDRALPETRPLRDGLIRLAESGRMSATVDGRAVEVELAATDRARLVRRPELVHVPIAVLSMRLGEYRTAVQWADEATRIEARYADAWLVLLTALARGGDYAAARTKLLEARRAVPERAQHLDGFEAALLRAESIARMPAEDERSRAYRAAAVADALVFPSGVLAAFGTGCTDGSARDIAIRCAVASAAVGDLDGALAGLEARARVAPEEASELDRVARELRAAAQRPGRRGSRVGAP